MTREEKLTQLISIRDHCKSMIKLDEPDSVWHRDVEALDMAISALRAQQELESKLRALESKEPLTLDELRKMDNQPVWIVEYPDWGHWELSEYAEDYVLCRDEDFYGMKYDDPDGRYGLHKLAWLAYRQKPEEGTV